LEPSAILSNTALLALPMMEDVVRRCKMGDEGKEEEEVVHI
jgi:hypothetical protein